MITRPHCRGIALVALSLILGAAVAVFGSHGLTWFEAIQLSFATATLPWALAFIWLFGRDPWWRSWFGRSLMMIAVAVAATSLSGVLFRLFGPDYWGRPVILVAAAVLAFAAMVTRTFVLRDLQAADDQG